MLPYVGISRDYQEELIGLMADLECEPGLDIEVRRRAQYLKWGLQGYEPGGQPLEFIAAGTPPQRHLKLIRD